MIVKNWISSEIGIKIANEFKLFRTHDAAEPALSTSLSVNERIPVKRILAALAVVSGVVLFAAIADAIDGLTNGQGKD